MLYKNIKYTIKILNIPKTYKIHHCCPYECSVRFSLPCLKVKKKITLLMNLTVKQKY